MISIKEFLKLKNNFISSKVLSNFIKKEVGENDWFLLETKTIFNCLEEKYVREENDIVFSKINALKTICMSDSFFEDYLCFEKIVQSICGNIVKFDERQELQVFEIVLALEDIKKWLPFEEKDFSLEICGYVAACCCSEGFVLAPESLDFCQKSLDFMSFDKVDNFFIDEDVDHAKKKPIVALQIIKNNIDITKRTSSLFFLNEDDMIDSQVIKLKSIEEEIRKY